MIYLEAPEYNVALPSPPSFANQQVIDQIMSMLADLKDKIGRTGQLTQEDPQAT